MKRNVEQLYSSSNNKTHEHLSRLWA